MIASMIQDIGLHARNREQSTQTRQSRVLWARRHKRAQSPSRSPRAQFTGRSVCHRSHTSFRPAIRRRRQRARSARVQPGSRRGHPRAVTLCHGRRVGFRLCSRTPVDQARLVLPGVVRVSFNGANVRAGYHGTRYVRSDDTIETVASCDATRV
jgi:hypothetical protein